MTDQNKSASSSIPRRFDLSKYKVCAAPKFKPEDVEKLDQEDPSKQLDLRQVKELQYNPEYSELKKAEARQQKELEQQGKLIKKNTLTGYFETTHLNEAQFEEQRRNFQFKGIAASTADKPNDEIRSLREETSRMLDGSKLNKSKRRVRNDDPTDIDCYSGPWAAFEDERHSCKPNEEDAAIIAEYMAKKKKRRSQPAGEEASQSEADQERAQLHIKDPYDYQGRSFLQAPRDLDNVNLYAESSPEGCHIPTTCGHTFKGHTKELTAIKYFPKTAHLLLSSSLDGKVKLWEMYKERRCVMTYYGHKHGVKDICFNLGGDRFVSASYDRYCKLWDTETGQCIQRFTNGKMAYCVKFNPDPEHSHLFLAGMDNKKIICWDCRSGEIVQEYDRHLGAINSITFVDENRKFISSSDDKSMRVWEWDIPVDVKYIADPTLHSMPAVTPSPNNKRLLCQSMDNKIQAFSCHGKFKLDNKKVFKGHMVAGYACVPDFSCDMSLVVSGDADGKLFFWSWSSTKLIKTFKAHDRTCISVIWHPHEKRKLVTAGWDNLIKIWE